MGLRINYSANIIPLVSMSKKFERGMFHVLGKIAKEGRQILRSDFLSGQFLHLKSSDTDVIGRHLITGRMFKKHGGGIVFRSYPVNLFERGRHWKTGGFDPGRRIFSRFETTLGNRMPLLANNAFNSVMDELTRNV